MGGSQPLAMKLFLVNSALCVCFVFKKKHVDKCAGLLAYFPKKMSHRMACTRQNLKPIAPLWTQMTSPTNNVYTGILETQCVGERGAGCSESPKPHGGWDAVSTSPPPPAACAAIRVGGSRGSDRPPPIIWGYPRNLAVPWAAPTHPRTRPEGGRVQHCRSQDAARRPPPRAALPPSSLCSAVPSPSGWLVTWILFAFSGPRFPGGLACHPFHSTWPGFFF